MLLILEICLTVAAWRRGWRWRALVPLGAFVLVALLLGMAVGVSGGSVEGALPVAVLVELAYIGTLIGLVCRPKRALAPARPVSEAAVPAGVRADGRR